MITRETTDFDFTTFTIADTNDFNSVTRRHCVVANDGVASTLHRWRREGSTVWQTCVPSSLRFHLTISLRYDRDDPNATQMRHIAQWCCAEEECISSARARTSCSSAREKCQSTTWQSLSQGVCARWRTRPSFCRAVFPTKSRSGRWPLRYLRFIVWHFAHLRKWLLRASFRFVAKFNVGTFAN